MNPLNPQEIEIIQPSALEAISRAEIDVSIATARRFPRNLQAVKLAMMGFATLDEDTAAACFYTLPRGGKNIQGPSVRLAEIGMACYGNIRAATRIIQTVTGDSPHVVIQSIAMDLEKNVSVSIEKRRRIVGKKSAGGAISDDDIQLAANAGSAIAFRDSIFKIIPLALIKPVFEAARKVAIGDARTLNDRRARCIDTFAKMGVTKDKVLAKLEKKSVEEVGLEDLETLIGLHNAIKEGELTVDEAFKVGSTVTSADVSDLGPVTKPAATPASTAPSAAATAPQATKAAETGTPAEQAEQEAAERKELLASVSLVLEQNEVTLAQLLKFATTNKVLKPNQKLTDASTAKLRQINRALSLPATIKELQAVTA